MKENDEILLQFKGYNDTPLLWKSSFYGLLQFQLDCIEIRPSINHPEKRLGKRAEQFFIERLTNSKDQEVVCQNVQIKVGKITVGEIDCIVNSNGSLVHVEHIYKFYLYDETIGQSEIDHWIGPNRIDSLLFKLDKLKEKQLPLLRTKEAENLLKSLKIRPESLEQKVHFKAQLFVPHGKTVLFESINKDAVAGWYYRKSELPKSARYFLPSKIEWLVNPHDNVKWKEFKDISVELDKLLENKKSPICWINSNTGDLEKCFVVWW
ncbi:MAG: DUF1853 family protein [Crocinitomicaceae bacterium]|nr:DUF1853 family protein [Crocinitomicaceae bacterium]